MHGRREPQIAAEKLSHVIAKRWRIDENRTRMKCAYFEFLSTRRETGVKQTTNGLFSNFYPKETRDSK